MQTEYTIVKEFNRYTVYDAGATAAKGFSDPESALHAIWVMEGSDKSCFYELMDGDVFRSEYKERNNVQ